MVTYSVCVCVWSLVAYVTVLVINIFGEKLVAWNQKSGAKNVIHSLKTFF